MANITAGNGVPLLDAASVIGNGGGNTMTGSGGFNLWYGDPDRDTFADYDPDTEFFIRV